MSVFICCGSDKGYVFSISFDCETLKFTDQFIDPKAHQSPVTSIICDKNYLISAGNDGSLQSYSLNQKRKLSTFDNLHNSKIRSLNFSSDGNYLFTSADDGMIIIWKKSGNIWEPAKVINKVKKSLTLSVHPSDKFALSISNDNHFRVWNLYNGLQSHKMQLFEQYRNLSISPNGTYYMLCTCSLVNVYEIQEASLTCSIKINGSIKDVIFIEDTILCIAEMKKITFYSFLGSVKELFSINLEQFSFKYMSLSKSLDKFYLTCIMASNLETVVQIYDVSLIEGNEKIASLIGSHNLSNLRITSLHCVYK